MSLAHFPRKGITLSLLIASTLIPAQLVAQQTDNTQVTLKFSFNGPAGPSSDQPGPGIAVSSQFILLAVNNPQTLAIYNRTGVMQGQEPASLFFPPFTPPPGETEVGTGFVSIVGRSVNSFSNAIYCPAGCPDTVAVKASVFFNPTTSTTPNVLNLSFIFDNDYNLTQRTIGVIDPSPTRSINDVEELLSETLGPTTRPRAGFNGDYWMEAWTSKDPTAHAGVFDPSQNFTRICQGDIAVPGPLLPAEMHEAPSGGPLWFVAAAAAGDSAITLIRVDNPASGGGCFSNAAVFVVPVSPYQAPPLISETVCGSGPDCLVLQVPSGATIQGAYWRGNRLEVVHTVSSEADNFSTARVRLYDIDTSTGQPQLNGTYEISPGPGVNTYAPGVAVNAVGAVGLTYMESSKTEFPAIYVTGKSLGAQSFVPGILVQASPTTLGGTFPVTMVDDYSGIAVDPLDNSFWATSEWGPTGPQPNWATTIANFSVTLPPPCATDVSGSVAITKSGYLFNAGTQLFSQTVKITNTSGAPINGPIAIALDSLSSNANLFNASGQTSCAAPAGSPYIKNNTATLLPGGSISTVLQFADPARAAITYRLRVLAGSAW